MTDIWIQVLAIIGSNLIIMLTFFGVSISLHNGMREEIRAINEEMKDFHTKLALQDSVFKSHILHLHEEGKKIQF